MNKDEKRHPRSEGQTFLVGPTLYFRPIEPGDGTTAPIWRKSPFPVPAEVVDKEIAERLDKGIWAEEKQQLLLACRRDDDRPVGSVDMSMGGWRYVFFDLHVDSLLSDGDQDRSMAEMLDLLLTWTICERNVQVIEFRGPDGRPQTHATVERHGGRVSCRFREWLLVDGQRKDELVYQVFNPVWIEKLGPPPVGVDGVVDREVRAPASHSSHMAPDDRIDRAMVVGERIYLAPFDTADTSKVARWAVEETEIHFPEGRWVANGPAMAASLKKTAEDDPPSALRFAIIDRKTDEVIGINGLLGISWVAKTAETTSELFQPRYRGSGFGTEAKHLLLEYAFDTLGLHAIYAYVSETNPRSAAAVRKQGYRDAGYLAWDAFGPDGVCGAWMFDLLASEWRAARDAARRQAE